MAEVVEHRHRMTRRQQHPRHSAADVSRSACYKNLHNSPIVPILDTTKVPVSMTYAYGNILAVSDWQSPGIISSPHGACCNLLQCFSCFPMICQASRLSQRQRS